MYTFENEDGLGMN